MAEPDSIPVFDNAPLYLRLTLVFPYTKGMLFQNAVFERDGQKRLRRGFSQAAGLHAADPASGEIFCGREAHPTGAAPARTCRKGYKSLVGGSLGELEHTIMLEQYSGKARPRKLRRTGAAARSNCWRTRRPAAIVLALRGRVGHARTPPASTSRPIAGSFAESGNRWRSPPKPRRGHRHRRRWPVRIAPQRRHCYQHGRSCPLR